MLLVPAGNAFAQTHAVWWTPDLGLNDLAGLPAAMSAEVRLGGPPSQSGLVLNNGSEETSASTCDEFLDAKDAGFNPRTTLAMSIQSTFVRRCYVLRELGDVKAATQSFLARDGWLEEAPDLLPPLLYAGERSVRDRMLEARANGQSWKQHIPALELESVDAAGVNLVRDLDPGRALPAGEPRYLEHYRVLPQAYGDFNDDGIEDVVVYATIDLSVGSLVERKVFVLTQHTPGAVMTILQEY